MKRNFLPIATCLLSVNFAMAQSPQLKQLPTRVNIEQDSARKSDIIDGVWAGVGIKKKSAIQHDYALQFNGRPSYRFSLEADDNTLTDYDGKGTKGRAELAYAYATHDDFKDRPEKAYQDAQMTKTVYLNGKGRVPQASSCTYQFSFYLPSSYPANTNTIFAQWHGMPDRTLISTPDGKIKKLTIDEFAQLYDRMIFNKDTGYDKVKATDQNGNAVYKADKKPNGWLIEQGGYPPLAFGFSDGYFYIKANSDRKWLTDKSDRCNANVGKTAIMQPVKSVYKASTIAYKTPFEDFPKDCWITFSINVTWSKYGGQAQTIVKDGLLDVQMDYSQNGSAIKKHIVNHQQIQIGRNDEDGYYFKFGIYRLGSSTVPVSYNLAGFSEQIH